jgi:hypothetical protein
MNHLLLLIPAQAGTQGGKLLRETSLDPRFRGGDGIGDFQ